MNKKGYLTNFIFGMIGLFVLVLILVAFISVQKGGVSPENVTRILDNSSRKAIGNLQINESNSAVVNVVYSFMHFILYSSFEITKAAVDYGVSNPSFINPVTLIWIVMISLLIPIVWYGFLMLASVFLIIREWYLNKKEKRMRN